VPRGSLFAPVETVASVIEAEVHSNLRAFLRAQADDLTWPHHLTMARLVARALRLGRSALVQTGGARGYRLSYLVSALLWEGPVLLVAPESVQRQMRASELPRLQEWLQVGEPGGNGTGLRWVTPERWLRDRLAGGPEFPEGIPTIIDCADDLETWTRQVLTSSLTPADWNDAIAVVGEPVRAARVALTKALFDRPRNPYQRHLLADPERDILAELCATLAARDRLAEIPAFGRFWTQFQQPGQVRWAEVDRDRGRVELHCSPVTVAEALAPLWRRQPTVLVGGFLDAETGAPVYRQQLGLGDLTCLRFSRDRRDCLQLYVPDRLPLPNSPQFQTALVAQLRALLARLPETSPAVILIGDVPLRAQIAAILAGDRGSRVRVETEIAPNGIAICGWEYWREHRAELPTPHLLAIATLPLPSLEDPLVAGRVSDYKRRRLDWFRLYLLPTALRELQRAIPRDPNSVVALLDNRLSRRSYGHQVLGAIAPYARVNFLDGIEFPDAPDPD